MPKGKKFPQNPFDVGRSGEQWCESSRKTAPASFKKGGKKTKKGK